MKSPEKNPVPVDDTIVIVDDHEANLRGMARLLCHNGYSNCELISDSREAVARCVELRPSLLVLDWIMPHVSGIDVLRELRAQLDPEEMPPVLVLSADDSPATPREALLEGATDYISKPVDQAELLLRIRNLLQLNRLYRQSLTAQQDLEREVKERTSELVATMTELREMQQHAIQQERLHALGTMAAGIAHDFNNALTIIRGYSDLHLREDANYDPVETHASFEAINKASVDAVEIVRRLREFYRPYNERDEIRDLLNLNTLAEEAVRLSAPRWEIQAQSEGLRVEVKTTLQPVPLVSASATELREILLNLIFNSIDAMPGGGEITLSTGTEPDGAVFIAVADNGQGMDEPTRQRCLEPFFTTKGEKGTGLGLAITYGIVQRHGGTVRIDSQPMRGTCITIVLPPAAHRIADPPAADLADTAAASTPTLRLLLVEDEKSSALNAVSEPLLRDGHTVVLVDNADAAVQHLQRGKFDLVISDCAQPGIDGARLAEHIKRLNPGQRVVLCVDAQTCGQADLSRADHVAIKPLTAPGIRESIARALHPASPSDTQRIFAA